MTLNPIGIIVLLALLGSYLLGLIAEVLNLRSLKRPMPQPLASLYDPEEYARSQAYTRDRTRLSLLSDTVGIVVVLCFWWLGGFGHLDQWLRSFDLGAIPTGLLYIGMLLVAQAVVGLPFQIYSTFVIEERYGFNRTTWGTWLLDRVKAVGLGLLIGVPVLSAILYFYIHFGDLAWLYSWFAVAAFSLVLQYVAPTWIMPLFNRFEPLEEGSLRERILDYGRSVSFPLKNVMVMDGSKRSSKANAFFTGFGRNRRVALFDTLIEKHAEDELIGIVAHEIGHYKKRHILISTAVSIAHTGLLFYVLSLVLGSELLFAAFSVTEPSVYVGFVLFGLLYAPVELLLSVLMSALSRRHEFQADRFAAETTGRPQSLADALKHLTRDHLGNLTPHPLYVVLNYSHPPLSARLEALASSRSTVADSSPAAPHG